MPVFGTSFQVSSAARRCLPRPGGPGLEEKAFPLTTTDSEGSRDERLSVVFGDRLMRPVILFCLLFCLQALSAIGAGAWCEHFI